jgi:hypothetical protein
MAYAVRNFKTKKALKEAVEAHKKGIGPAVEAFQPGPFGVDLADGRTCIEGPHYPEPHRWYASADIKDGVIVAVR